MLQNSFLSCAELGFLSFGGFWTVVSVSVLLSRRLPQVVGDGRLA